MKWWALGVLALRVMGAAMTYVFVMVAARLMSSLDFGLMGSVFAASLLLSVFGSYGQQQAMVRYIPPLLNRADRPAVSSLVKQALGVALVGNLLLWLVLVAAIGLAGLMGFSASSWVLAFGFLIVPLTGLIDFQAYLARAHKAVLMAVLPKDVLWRLASLCILVPVAVVTGRDLPLGMVFAVLIGVLIAIIATNAVIAPRVYGMPKLSELWHAPSGAFDVEQWKRSNIAFWITSVASVALVNIDVVAVGALIGPESAGLYFAANRVALAPGFFEQSYTVVISPIFAEHAASGDTRALRHTAVQATRHTFVPTLIMSVCLAVFAPHVLGLFGEEFRVASPQLWVLLTAAVMNVAFGQPDLLLVMGGHEKAAMWVSVVSTAVGAAAIVIGALLWQSIGVALGVLFAVFLRKAWFWARAAHFLDVRSDIVSAMIDLLRRRDA